MNDSAHDPLRERERVQRREALRALIEDAEINDLYAKTDRPAPKTR